MIQDSGGGQSPQVDDNVIEGMRKTGMPEEAIAQFRRQAAQTQPNDQFEVWQENWQSLLLFSELARRLWRGEGAAIFDSQAIESTLRLKGIPRNRWSELFSDIAVMERAALDELESK